MAGACASPTLALPTPTLMAGLVADQPTSIMHSQCRQLFDQNGVLMLATQTKAAQTGQPSDDLDSLSFADLAAVLACPVEGQPSHGLDSLSSAELERRKQQKRRRRAQLKQLAQQQAAKQARRRTPSGGKQRHEQGDVRKKSAANRRHSAERAGSRERNWANFL